MRAVFDRTVWVEDSEQVIVLVLSWNICLIDRFITAEVRHINVRQAIAGVCPNLIVMDDNGAAARWLSIWRLNLQSKLYNRVNQED